MSISAKKLLSIGLKATSAVAAVAIIVALIHNAQAQTGTTTPSGLPDRFAPTAPATQPAPAKTGSNTNGTTAPAAPAASPATSPSAPATNPTTPSTTTPTTTPPSSAAPSSTAAPKRQPRRLPRRASYRQPSRAPAAIHSATTISSPAQAIWRPSRALPTVPRPFRRLCRRQFLPTHPIR